MEKKVILDSLGVWKKNSKSSVRGRKWLGWTSLTSQGGWDENVSSIFLNDGLNELLSSRSAAQQAYAALELGHERHRVPDQIPSLDRCVPHLPTCKFPEIVKKKRQKNRLNPRVLYMWTASWQQNDNNDTKCLLTEVRAAQKHCQKVHLKKNWFLFQLLFFKADMYWTSKYFTPGIASYMSDHDSRLTVGPWV